MPPLLSPPVTLLYVVELVQEIARAAQPADPVYTVPSLVPIAAPKDHDPPEWVDLRVPPMPFHQLDWPNPVVDDDWTAWLGTTPVRNGLLLDAA